MQHEPAGKSPYLWLGAIVIAAIAAMYWRAAPHFNAWRLGVGQQVAIGDEKAITEVVKDDEPDGPSRLVTVKGGTRTVQVARGELHAR